MLQECLDPDPDPNLNPNFFPDSDSAKYSDSFGFGYTTLMYSVQEIFNTVQ
jgi:hypothetical protein